MMKKKSRFNKNEIKFFQKKLKREKKNLEKELKELELLIADQEKYVARTEMDFGSDASKIRNVEMLKNMRRRMVKRRRDYRDAIRKIVNGTYGICEKTNKKISKQRLIALPTARTCMRLKG
jgi:DnaK suppressor protein